MDASLLTSQAFWDDRMPIAAGNFPGEIPDLPGLRGHVLFETSGSSGTPKWIALSKAALLTSAAAVNEHLEVASSSCWGLALPTHHVGGFGVVARAFVAGCGFREFRERWDAAAFAVWLEGNRVTHTSLVPTQVHDMVAANLRSPGLLKAIVVGGGHLNAETGQAARALGWPVLASYGMTEAASQIATQRLDSLTAAYQPSPIPLLPIWKAEVSNEQTLRISGEALFSGMLVLDDETWTFKPRAVAWHQTADRVALENDCLTPLGRADTLIKVLGELVDPEMIERELASLSEGKLAPGTFVVVAVPDARTENSLVPVFDAEVDKAIINAAMTTYAEHAPGFRRLTSAVYLEDFPRSPLGKPRRAEITARCVSRA